MQLPFPSPAPSPTLPYSFSLVDECSPTFSPSVSPILFCLLSERDLAEEDEVGGTEDEEAAASLSKGVRVGFLLEETSGVVAGGSLFLLLLFRLPVASGSFSLRGSVPVSIAVVGVECAPVAEEGRWESKVPVGAAWDCRLLVAAARFPSSFLLKSTN